jgi:hypothetical protein
MLQTDSCCLSFLHPRILTATDKFQIDLSVDFMPGEPALVQGPVRFFAYFFACPFFPDPRGEKRAAGAAARRAPSATSANLSDVRLCTNTPRQDKKGGVAK